MKAQIVKMENGETGEPVYCLAVKGENGARLLADSKGPFTFETWKDAKAMRNRLKQEGHLE